MSTSSWRASLAIHVVPGPWAYSYLLGLYLDDRHERLGVRWTQSNPRTHRASVAVLDGFIGPKT